MNKIEKFVDDLYNRRLDFDAYTVKDLDFTSEEALEVYDILRTKLVDEKDLFWANVQSIIFLFNMHYFGVTSEILTNHLETKYNYGK